MADTYPVSRGVNEPDGVFFAVQLYRHRFISSWKKKTPNISQGKYKNHFSTHLNPWYRYIIKIHVST